MLDYRGALAGGWDIGSGSTEAMCKNLTLRLKRTGMKWDPPNAAAGEPKTLWVIESGSHISALVDANGEGRRRLDGFLSNCVDRLERCPDSQTAQAATCGGS